MRKCTKCSVWKKESLFSIVKHSVRNCKRKRHVYCLECKRAGAREWASKNYSPKAMRDWREKNRDKALLNWRITRASRRKREVSWADRKKIRSFYIEAARLTKETGIPHEVDHIIPLKGRTVSGLHHEGNLQILTQEQNRKKANK